MAVIREELWTYKFRTMSQRHFHLDRTETSPQVDLDVDNGIMEFIGRSLPHNSEQFYARVYGWLEEYLPNAKDKTTVNMKLDYLDTSSSKHFYNIFSRLDAVTEGGRRVEVNWHFETGDEEMAETGKDYQSLFKMDFAFIEVEELF
jgi:hypothetical protein